MSGDNALSVCADKYKYQTQNPKRDGATAVGGGGRMGERSARKKCLKAACAPRDETRKHKFISAVRACVLAVHIHMAKYFISLAG